MTLPVAPALLAISCWLPQDPQPMQVETFGLRTIARETIVAAVGQVQAEQLDADALRKKLLAIDGVADVSIAPVSVGKRTLLYVGIREGAEGNAAPQGFRAAPAGKVTLPQHLVDSYDDLMAATKKAVEVGETRESHADGHSLLQHQPARLLQEQFVFDTRKHLALLRDVLRNAGDASHRRAAALILGYADDKKDIVKDLVFATGDADATVRNNAVRNLAVLLMWAQEKGHKIAVDFRPFYKQLDSLTWSDRNKSLLLLVAGQADPKQLPAAQQIELARTLREMALWAHPEHSLPAVIVLGKLVGDDNTFSLYAGVHRTRRDRKARQKLIDDLVAKLPKKK